LRREATLSIEIDTKRDSERKQSLLFRGSYEAMLKRGTKTDKSRKGLLDQRERKETDKNRDRNECLN
jgi:hypothetical protein